MDDTLEFDFASSSGWSTCCTVLGFRLRTFLLLLATIYTFLTLLITGITYRVLRVLARPKPARRGGTAHRKRGRLLVVLGSGGHTAEMLRILQNLGAEYLNSRFSRRTYVVSSGDSFSAERAKQFEWTLSTTPRVKEKEADDDEQGGYFTAGGRDSVRWDIVTVTRARMVHQPLRTTPVSALACLWDCIQVLRGTHVEMVVAEDKHRHRHTENRGDAKYPDLILTNGPGTGVVVVLASLVLLVLGLVPLDADGGEGGSMRSIYVESWARVRTLSLSGKILRFMAGRFLVQWPGLASEDATALTDDAHFDTGTEDEPRKKGKGAVGEEERASSGNRSKRSVLPRRIEYVGAVVT